VVVNIIGSLALFFVIGHVGIAVATSLAGWTNAGLLARTLARRGDFTADGGLRSRLGPICLSSAIMGLVLWWLGVGLEPWFAPNNGLLIQSGALALLVGAGLLIFALAAQLTGAVHLQTILRSLARG